MQKIIGVIGGSFVEQKYLDLAFQVGKLLAKNGATIVCGGLGGVMEAVCKGASEENGLTVGLLPAGDIKMANKYVKVPLATGMGSARNKIIVESAQALIAIAGAYGTLSEIALALDAGKKVIGLETWDIPGVITATTAEEAVKLAFEECNG
jgi:uncharacterized protein (TIGR00725 family)